MEGRRTGDKGHCWSLSATARGVRAWGLHQALAQHTLGAVGTKKGISQRPLLTDPVPPSSSEKGYTPQGWSLFQESVSTALPAWPSWALLQRCLLQHLSHPSLKHLL